MRSDIMRWMAKSCKRSHIRTIESTELNTRLGPIPRGFANTIISVERPSIRDSDVSTTIFLPKDICYLSLEESSELKDRVSVEYVSYHALVAKVKRDLMFEPTREEIVYRYKSRSIRISDDSALRAAIIEML